MKKILVTGSAGFIGFHLTQRLLDRGDVVVGIDNLNDYYDVNLKIARLAQHGIAVNAKTLSVENKVSTNYPKYTFYKLDLTDREGVNKLFEEHQFEAVVNLAAQAGVRYSITNPQAYIDANIQGFINILEPCRHHRIGHLVYASSSSVYGSNTKMPLSIHDNVDHPISLYAATKKSNELMAHTYSHLYQIPTTGLRFFTVYGPWGRPDMALFLFTKAIIEGKPIQVFNEGNMVRDFTFVADIVEGIIRVTDNPAKPNEQWIGDEPDPGTSKAPYRVYNIGNSNPVKLMDYIAEIEKQIGKTAIKELMPMQPGDVPKTFSDVTDLEKDLGYKPNTPISHGIGEFVKWYREYFGIG